MISGVSIIYNGVDVFYPQPTPFISLEERNIYYGELWGKEERLVMDGQITGCTFDQIFNNQVSLLDKFGKNYQVLEIWQFKDGVSGKVFQKDLVNIESIEFPQSRWIGVLPYTITTSCYPSGYFSGAYGILNPNDSWEYEEKDNLTLDAIHTISCQGLNTSNVLTNALENAKNWVYGRTGVFPSVPTPNFIGNSTPSNFLLLTINENIDRINGTYSVKEKYSNDLTRGGYGIIRYSTSISSGNNILTVSLNGSVQGANRDISKTRTAFSGINPFGVASNAYQSLFGENDLNPNILSQNINEDTYSAIINFNYIYNNDNSPDVIFDYNVRLNSGETITAQIDGTVIARGGDLTTRFIKAQQYAATIDLYNLTVPFYNTFYPYSFSFPLNPKPISSGVSYAPSEGTVSLNAVFGNQNQVSNGLDSFDYTITFQPSLEKLDSKPKLEAVTFSPGELYSVVDLRYRNRASILINGDSVINEGTSAADGLTLIKSKCMAIFNENTSFIKPTLDQESISIDRFDNRKISFTFAWSFESPFPVAQFPYSNVSTLKVN